MEATAPVRVEPFPRERRHIVDAIRMGRRRNHVFGLVEFDVTEARRRLRTHEEQTGERLSFTAFLIASLGRVLAEQPEIHTYRDWRGRRFVFDRVDVSTLVETTVDGRPHPVPCVLRGVEQRSVDDLTREIRVRQRTPGERQWSRTMAVGARLPGVVRRLFYRLPHLAPRRWQQLAGSALVTSVGMFGSGRGWGITPTNHTVALTIGGSSERPGYVDGQLVPREYLCVTVAVDHDVVDGAPAARFVERLRTVVEAATVLEREA